VAYNESIPQLPDPSTTLVGPGWASQAILDTAPTQSNDLNGGSTVSVYQGGNYWTITLNYNSMPIDMYTNLGAFISGLRGSSTPFYVRLPDKANPKSGAWVLDTDAQKGLGNVTKELSDTIKVTNVSNLGGSLQVGDYLKLSTNDRIYKILAVNISSNTAYYKFHSLIEGTISSATYLEPNDIKFKCVLKGDKPREEIDTSGLVQGFSLSLKSTVI
jgi:hypothetical protein